MPEVLASWDDFSAGHWGNIGPRAAGDNTYGGVNMLRTRDGGIAPTSESRWMPLNAQINGHMYGMFWSWGADGYVYFIQGVGTSTISSRIYKFNPTLPSTTSVIVNNLTTVSTLTFVATTDPDWVEVGTTLYVTVYGIFTYVIETSGNTCLILTGEYGNAPAGRCMAIYGDRLFIGGVFDFRFGAHSNRLHFSGDDTNNDTPDRTAWETLNYFDIGATGDVITGLYNLRDYLVAVLDDQSIYLINGTPNVNLSARRVYGFHKGSGGITAFLPSHGAVDPSQTKAWLFDHTIRAPIRFNGAALTRVQQFGIPRSNRTGTDKTEGALCMIGGPDEFMAHGVAVSRAAGEGVIDHTLELVRVNGVYCLVQNDVIAARA